VSHAAYKACRHSADIRPLLPQPFLSSALGEAILAGISCPVC